MSYDLNAYSLSTERPLKENFRDSLQRNGWEIVFISDEARSRRAFLAADGPIEEEAIIIGWQTKDKNAALLTKAAAIQDIKTIEAIAETTQAIAGCAISVTIPYQVDKQQLADMAVRGEIHYADLMKSAQSHYYLRTAAGRSPLSFEFQRLVWLTIGEVCGGLLENPEDGEYIIFDASTRAV